MSIKRFDFGTRYSGRTGMILVSNYPFSPVRAGKIRHHDYRVDHSHRRSNRHRGDDPKGKLCNPTAPTALTL